MAKTRYNGEGSIRLRKDGRYEARISGCRDFSTGESHRISRYADTQEEAVRLLQQMNLSVGSGKIRDHNITLGDWLDLWMDVYMKHSLKQSTRASYETYAKRHFKPALGNLRLVELTPQILRQFYNYKIESEHLSSKTIINMNLYLHKALDQAYKENLISANPASALNLPRNKRPDIEILTRDEQATLMYVSYQHRYGIFVRLVLSTGLRMGELLGLKWEDIDCRRSMLFIRRTLNRVQIPGLPDNYKGPKTEIKLQVPKTPNSIRSIPLLPGLLQDLLNWKAVQDTDRKIAGDNYLETGMIVTNPSGGYIEARTFYDYYQQMLQMAGLRPFTFHALRHTFASRALEQGMDFKTVSILLGHASVAFTMDTYAHVLDSHKREGMQLMEELYTTNQAPFVPQCYPVLFSPAHADGSGYMVTAPDFPSIHFLAQTMEDGLDRAGTLIHTELDRLRRPPTPTPPGSIPPMLGQFTVQIPV